MTSVGDLDRRITFQARALLPEGDGTVYAITSPAMDPDGRGAFLEMLAKQGGAA